MDACSTVLTGETLQLTTPSTPEYLPLVLDFCENAARLAGFGPHGARRCRLIAEELFHQVAQECQANGRRDPCKLEATLTADGLNLCLTTDHLSWDPENEPAYSLAEVLEGEEPDGLGLHLVKRYAKSITLTRRGTSRELCLTLPRENDDQGVHPWHRLVPSLAPGVSLKPVEKDGRLVYKLEHAARGKTYLARALAHQVLTLVDGRQSFGQIMAQTMKVMPETGRHKLEDLFQVLMDRGVVTVQSLERPPAEIEVRQMLEPRTLQALNAYHKVSREGESPQG